MSGQVTLKRTLSLPMMVLYGLGTTIGAGIYALVGEVASVAGYYAPISFLIASILAGFTAISFAELSSRFPRAAGAALYVKQGFSSDRLSIVIGLLVIAAGLVSAAALVNGGKLIPPTLFPRTKAEATQLARQVIRPQTSDLMRYLMRLNVIKGSGKRAEVPGFLVGGKTGTAEKVFNGGYSNKHRFNAFLSTFPVTDPKYVVLVIVDEPKPEKGKVYATAGMNAAPAVANIVKRSAPLLGIQPDFRVRDTATLSSYRQ